MKTIKLIMLFTFCKLIIAAAATITILHVNDTHSHIDGSGQKNAQLEVKDGGIARAATLINKLRATEPNVLLLHAGDLFQGDPMFNTYFGVPELIMMKQLGFDAMAVGNHEFDLGPGVLNDALTSGFAYGSFPVLSANLDMSAFPSLLNFIQPSIIKNIGGVQVGIFGMTVPDNPTNIPAPVIINSNLAAIAQATVNDLRNNGAQIVICLSHLGINYDKVMISGSNGIDLVIGGHDHLVFNTPQLIPNSLGNNVPVFQAGAHYKYLGEIHLSYVNNHVQILDSQVIPISSSIKPDPAVNASIQQLKQGVIAQFGDIYHNVLSETNQEILKTPDGNTHWKDCPVGNLITDAFRNKYHTQIAITPNGFISEKLYKGKITQADVFRTVSYGFDPVTSKGFQMATFNLTGAELVKALEFGLSQLGVSEDFFLQYSGLKFEYDPNQPVGQRVLLSSVKIGRNNLSLTRIYSVAVNSGVAGLIPLAGLNVTNLSIMPEFEFDVVCNYLSGFRTVNYHSEGRIYEKSCQTPLRLADPSGIVNKEENIFPNPFNDQVNFRIRSGNEKHISITLHDITGKLVSTITDKDIPEGESTIQWDSSNLKEGIYFYQIADGEKVTAGKIICVH